MWNARHRFYLLIASILTIVFAGPASASHTYPFMVATYGDGLGASVTWSTEGAWTTAQTDSLRGRTLTWSNVSIHLEMIAGPNRPTVSSWSTCTDLINQVYVRFQNPAVAGRIGETTSCTVANRSDKLWGSKIRMRSVPAAGYTWNYASRQPTANEFDFATSVGHELGHALGWGPVHFDEGGSVPECDGGTPGDVDHWMCKSLSPGETVQGYPLPHEEQQMANAYSTAGAMG